MKQITINPNNEPYYSEDFTKGFKCGAERQFEADKADRPQGEWVRYMGDIWTCSACGESLMCDDIECNNFCPNCGARMKGADDEDN